MGDDDGMGMLHAHGRGAYMGSSQRPAEMVSKPTLSVYEVPPASVEGGAVAVVVVFTFKTLKHNDRAVVAVALLSSRQNIKAISSRYLLPSVPVTPSVVTGQLP